MPGYFALPNVHEHTWKQSGNVVLNRGDLSHSAVRRVLLDKNSVTLTLTSSYHDKS